MLGDRAGLSGAGALSVSPPRALSDVYGEMRAPAGRLLQAFPRRLARHGCRAVGPVAILTPAPQQSHYEHAYIARYLGIMLLEGADLTVSDGRLMVRTVSG